MAPRRVCAAAIFREPRLRARCRFCALFVLLFSLATTKMSGAVVIVHSPYSLLSCTVVSNDFLKLVRLHYNGIIKRCNRLRFLPC